MNKVELVTAIVAKLANDYEVQMTKKDTTAMVDALVETVVETVAGGEDVKIAGLGTFSQSVRQPRTGVNPATGQKIEIGETKSPKFKAASAFKAAVKEA